MSVRSRLIGWLQMLIDHLSEKPMKELGGAHIHPQTTFNLADRLGAAFYNASSQGEIHNAVNMASVGQNVHELNRLSTVNNLPEVGTHGNLATGSLDNFNNSSGLGVSFNHLLSSQNMNHGQSFEGLKNSACNQAGYLNSLNLAGQSGLTNQSNAFGKRKHG